MTPLIALLTGDPDPTTLGGEALEAAFARALSSSRQALSLGYGADPGSAALLGYLSETLGIRREELMIVAGATHAVDMIARLCAPPDGVVLVEVPTFGAALSIFRDHRIELRGVAMDAEGLVPADLRRCLIQLRAEGKSVRFLYTIPCGHNPTGRTTPESRRREVVALAREHDFLIVEDDIYRALTFDGPPPLSYHALSGGRQVVSIGSFSKTLAPGLRLGWFAAPKELVQRCIDCGTTQMGGGASAFVAEAVADYCRQGHWTEHVAALRLLYRVRRDVACAALRHFLSADVRWTRPAAGFFVWLELPEGVDARDIVRGARAGGVSVVSGESFFLTAGEGRRYVRIAFSFAPLEELTEGIRILGRVIDGGRQQLSLQEVS